MLTPRFLTLVCRKGAWRRPSDARPGARATEAGSARVRHALRDHTKYERRPHRNRLETCPQVRPKWREERIRVKEIRRHDEGRRATDEPQWESETTPDIARGTEDEKGEQHSGPDGRVPEKKAASPSPFGS
jgi:hypothetical protein